MNLVLAVTVVLLLAQFALPRKLAFLPMLVALLHLGNVSVISEFTPMRLVILAGLMRAVSGGFFQWSARNRLDQLAVVFAVVALISTVGHEGNEYVRSPLIERCGLILNVLGSYLYARAYVSGVDFLTDFSRLLAILIIPLGFFLILEQGSGSNYYSELGSRGKIAALRNEESRAQGPFGHAIIAGTACAVAVPFMVFLWRGRKGLAGAGMAGALAGIFSTGSSGPIAALAISVVLLVMWRWRQHLRKIRNCFWLLLIFLNFAMSRPIWFLISRIQIVGGSTGWHRSKLIDTAIKDWQTWWLFGTDHTRHWMHSGVSWNPNHTDITNYYLQMGVLGGLPLMISFIAMIVVALSSLEKSFVLYRESEPEREFGLWCVWTSILAHCASFLSIAYFDQSYAGFFLLVGAAPALFEAAKNQSETEDEPAPNESPEIWARAVQPR